MSLVKRNVIANVVGKLWVAGINFAVLPVYARLLGLEAYGLVGLFASIQVLLMLMDFGLSPTLALGLARLSVDRAVRAQEMRDLVMTLSGVFVASGVICGGALAVLAPTIAVHWVHAEHLPPATVWHAIALMGVVVAVQWPSSLFLSGLTGLQQQVTSNQLQVGAAVARAATALLILSQASRTIEAFFVCQAANSVVFTIISFGLLQRHLPKAAHRGRLRMAVLQNHWRFATGMALISILSVILMQADKIILSRQLSLSAYGAYSLAASAASAAALLVGPALTAFYPRYCQLAAIADQRKLAEFYHNSCQLIAVVALPPTMLLVGFSYDVMHVWTGDIHLSRSVASVLTLLAIGYGLNALVSAAYSLQLAHEWTSLTLTLNAVVVVVVLPTLYFVAAKFGVRGVAATWIGINFFSFTVNVQLMHRRILRGELGRWYLIDVGIPVLTCVMVAVLGQLLPDATSRLGAAAKLAGLGTAAAIGIVIAAPTTRKQLEYLIAASDAK